MTAGAVRPFLPELRRLDAELRLPIPRRLRILRELEYDLEELAARLVEQGMAPEEARRRALDALLPGGDATAALDGVHGPLYRRLTRRVGDRRLRRLERGTLALFTAGVLAAQAAALLQADLLAAPSAFLWPVLAAGAVLCAGAAAKAFQLWVLGDHRTPQRGLDALLAGSGGVLCLGLVGALVDVYRVLDFLEVRPLLAPEVLPDALLRVASLLSVSLVLALSGALAWFVLRQWLVVVSDARHRALGLDAPVSSAPSSSSPSSVPPLPEVLS